MARSSYPTLLSLDRYASIMNINSCHFNGVGGVQLVGGGTLFPLDNAQNDIWPRYSWQANDQVSHEELGREIWLAEQEIADVLGYFAAPTWTTEEMYAPEHFYRPEVYGLPVDPRWGVTGFVLRHGKFIASGRRAVTILDPRAAVVYTDGDGDGFKEIATVTVIVPAGMDIKEIKLYYSGHNGEQEWELRTPRLVTLVGTTFTAIYNTWVMIEPNISELFPTDNGAGIDLNTSTNLLGSVECYREYTDTTQAGVRFTVLDCTGSPAEYDGYVSMVDPSSNFVMPVRADYNAVTGLWEIACEDNFQYANLWYKSGLIDPQYRPRVANDLLSDNLATAIAYMSAARLGRIYATNNNATALSDKMSTDLAIMTSGQGARNRYITPDLMNNPFGTFQGEYEAWKRVRLIREKRIGVATI